MLATLSLTTLYLFGNGHAWDYDEADQNTSHWEQLSPECAYSRQSPIDVPMDITSECREPLELQWSSEHTQYVIRNNGHSLQAIPFTLSHNGGSDLSGLEVLHHKNDTNIRLKNSFYGTYESKIHKEYCFDSLHFHWGRHDNEGSEHTINGKFYPLELHLVHYSCDYYLASDALHDYQTGEAAIKYDDDNVLAVIGVMFEIGAANPVLDEMLDDVIMDGIYHSIKDHGDATHKLLNLYYTEFDVKGLLPASREMVGYLGSLTTPPCFETVRWHIMKETMTVSEEQMEKFRKMLESNNVNDSMAPNYRPVQKLNGRKIYQCQNDVNSEIIAWEVDEGRNKEIALWQYISIGFMAAFVVTVAVCCAVVIYCCRQWNKIGASFKLKQNPSTPEKSNSHHEDDEEPNEDEEDVDDDDDAHAQNVKILGNGGH